MYLGVLTSFAGSDLGSDLLPLRSEISSRAMKEGVRGGWKSGESCSGVDRGSSRGFVDAVLVRAISNER